VASHSLPIPLSSVRRPTRERAAVRTPSVRIVITVSIALLILFSWLRLILALEIASTGRQIQISSEELDRIKRDNQAMLLKIAEAMTPRELADLAAEWGFAAQKPVYVPAVLPSPEPVTEEGVATAMGDEVPAPADQSLSGIVSRQLDRLLEAECTP
jgi:hypothetical protein